MKSYSRDSPTHKLSAGSFFRHGDPHDLEDYKGGREYEALSKFVQELGGHRLDGAGVRLSTSNFLACPRQKCSLVRLEILAKDYLLVISRVNAWYY